MDNSDQDVPISDSILYLINTSERNLAKKFQNFLFLFYVHYMQH